MQAGGDIPILNGGGIDPIEFRPGGAVADEEEFLLEEGSKQEDLWGINLYPDKWPQADWIEFDSIIRAYPKIPTSLKL